MNEVVRDFHVILSNLQRLSTVGSPLTVCLVITPLQQVWAITLTGVKCTYWNPLCSTKHSVGISVLIQDYERNVVGLHIIQYSMM